MKGTSKKRIVISWVAVAAWACLIFFASAHTGDDFNRGDNILAIIKAWLDGVLSQLDIPGLKESSSLGHFFEYTVFGGLFANALRNHMPLRRACLIAVACASLYGVSDEFHQLFVPGRACDPADWVVDTLGAALGSTISYGIFRK